MGGRAERRSVTAAGLAEAGSNVALCVAYVLFALAQLRSFGVLPRASVLLLLVMETLFALFFLVRLPADRVSFTAWAWLTTLAGTLLPLALRPADASPDSTAGQILQVLGLSMGIAGVLSLNRSIGLLPAHRAIRTAGAYRLVRHPLYSAYTLMNLGYLASHRTAWNAAVVLAALSFQVLRLRNEEALLSPYDEYAAYRRQTRWRLVPFIY